MQDINMTKNIINKKSEFPSPERHRIKVCSFTGLSSLFQMFTK